MIYKYLLFYVIQKGTIGMDIFKSYKCLYWFYTAGRILAPDLKCRRYSGSRNIMPPDNVFQKGNSYKVLIFSNQN